METRESDLNRAAFLLTKGVKLARLEGTGHKVFIFEDPDNQIEYLKVEFTNNGLVPVSSFISAQRELKSLIYRDKR